MGLQTDKQNIMELITTHVVTKFDEGVHGNMFGGRMMSHIDLAGAALATQIARYPKMVTKKISEIVFHQPVKVNTIIKIYGEAVKVGRTSITLNLEVRRVAVETSQETLVCSCQLVFVKINEYGEPSPIETTICSIVEDVPVK